MEGCGRCHNFFGNKMIAEKGQEMGKFIGFKKGGLELSHRCFICMSLRLKDVFLLWF